MSQTEKNSGKSARVKIIFVALLAAAGFLGWWFFLRGPALPENIIAVSGRIEGDDSMVAAKTSGRSAQSRYVNPAPFENPVA